MTSAPETALLPGGVSLRLLTAIADFERCVALQREVWGFDDIDLIPRRLFVVASTTGGHVLGAFAGERLAGYVLGLPGFHGERRYLHSHMLAVTPGLRNTGIGRLLKLRQCELALESGIDLVEWTFDPLEAKNGYFNLMRLGVVARRYLPNHYGYTSSALQGGLPTDRLVAEWRLRSPRVMRVLEGQATAAVGERRVDVPAEIAAWKAASDPRARQTQERIRRELEAGFAAGLAAVGYERTPTGGAFLLGRAE